MRPPQGDVAVERLPPGLRWVGFDLDGTLHYFKRASDRAAETVLRDIARKYDTKVDDLAVAYRKILRSTQRRHFVEARTSREYRAERFRALLQEFRYDTESHLKRLLDIYDDALAAELELRPGAREALAAARRANLQVMVVSEGPHDAQETTIERLGIAGEVDLLVTSAWEGTSKSDRLFERAVAKARCKPPEVLFVGDSIARDIAPASALGMATVYVGEEDPPIGSSAMRISLPALARLLSSRAHNKPEPAD
jgi:putative hydrolase of the HAD superfamily